MGLFDSLSGGDSRRAAIAKAMGQQQGLQALQSTYGQGRDAATQSYQAGMQPFQTLFDQPQVATGAYSDALGLNGQAGNDAARARFQESPGYQFARDQGLQATERGINAGGMLASGNLLDALQKQGTGYAQQDWGNYLGRFAPLLTGEQQNRISGAQGLGTMNAHLGNTLNTSFMGQGDAANKAYTGIGDTTAAGLMAGQQASNNRLDMIGKGISFGTKLLGMF